MVQQGNRHAVDQHLRVFGLRATHQQRARDERRARHARHVLQHAKGISEGARHRGELTLLEQVLRDLTLISLGHDRGLEASRVALEVRLHLGDLALVHLGLELDLLVRRARHDQLERAERCAANLEVPLRVRLAVEVGAVDVHRGADERLARAGLANIAAHIHWRRWGRPGVDLFSAVERLAGIDLARRLQHEMVDVRDAHGAGFVVELGG